MSAFWDVYESPLGPLTLRAGEQGGLAGLAFPGRARELAEEDRRPDAARAGRRAARAVLRRRAAQLRAPSSSSWAAHSSSASGSGCERSRTARRSATAQLAHAVGRPDIVRGVAAAVGRTPVPIIIPCHRVVGARRRAHRLRRRAAAQAGAAGTGGRGDRVGRPSADADLSEQTVGGAGRCAERQVAHAARATWPGEGRATTSKWHPPRVPLGVEGRARKSKWHTPRVPLGRTTPQTATASQAAVWRSPLRGVHHRAGRGQARDERRAHCHGGRERVGLGGVARDHDGARRGRRGRPWPGRSGGGRRCRRRSTTAARSRTRRPGRGRRAGRRRVPASSRRRCSRPRGDRRARRPCRRRPRAGSRDRPRACARSRLRDRRSTCAPRRPGRARFRPARRPGGARRRRRRARPGWAAGRGVTAVRGERTRWLSR